MKIIEKRIFEVTDTKLMKHCLELTLKGAALVNGWE